MTIDDDEVQRIADAIPGDVSIYEVDGTRLKVLYFSKDVPLLSGMTAEEYQNTIADDASSIVAEVDRPIVAAKLGSSLISHEDVDLIYRIYHKTRESIWVHAKSRIIGERNGNPVMLCAFMDTSLETELHERLLDRVAEAVHVCDAHTMELLYVNKPAIDIWQCSSIYQGKTCFEFFHGRTSVCPWCGMKGEDNGEIFVNEMYDADIDRYFRLDRQKVLWHGREAFATFATDTTESSRIRRNLTAEKTQLEAIVEHIPAGICVFRMVNQKAELVAANEYLRDVLQTDIDDLGDFTRSLVIDRVHPDDRAEAMRVTRELMAGDASTFCDFRLKDSATEAYRWLHLDGRTMPQDNGSLLIFGSITDITARKLDEERYRKTIGDMLAANPQALCSFELNLTKNTCEEGRGTSELIRSMVSSDTADGVLDNLTKLVVDEDSLKTCREVFNREKLIDTFEKGTNHISVEYRRLSEESSSIWAKTYISMVRNPVTDNIESVIYSEDIDAHKREEMALRVVTENAYDYIGLIDIKSSVFTFQEMGAEVPNRYLRDVQQTTLSQDYEEIRRYPVNHWINPEDRDLYLENSTLDNIVHMLDTKDCFEFTIRGQRDEDESTRRKRLHYAYLDESRQTIIIWQTDITDAFLKERENAERLEVALSAAKQASNAKSVFLSRMSHEIRTPMNAIIGMDTLAAQAIGDDEKVADCISKIGISSRYLLSLINDILDMSRIESGKMLLKDDRFLMQELITQVDDLIYSQADAKNLDYECTVSPEVEDVYIGDVMKLQQILINILGNAVKFTEKGKVSLSVEQLLRKNSSAKIRFTINDTGIGMDEKEQERIFEPFEQIDTSTTTTFAGTGLGLAITRSLVELMGGTIRVRSIAGVGSEFIVEVPLGLDEDAFNPFKQTYSFEKMHTLIVDDDLIVCEQTKSILEEIGMIGEWVTSGMEAVEKVKLITLRNDQYDYILIDWKMPDMDGIETTRKIRRIVGPDVTIIIISAYDWESIERDAKAAGANLLVTKPLFKSTLISAFEKAQGQISERQTEKVAYDFTGKRLLVAEDNAINAEIALNLLESKGFAVDVAHDGLEAMEMFIQSPVGFYDAILMDVRMPQMDGLQATSSIRRWNKADAKTIPIIAMTANAFDEDVDKSRAAGMNAHLAKPIEPELMFRTLQRILSGEGNLI